MATSEATDGISAWPEPIEGELSNELEGQGDQSPSSPTQSQTPTSVSMTVPEPNTMVNIPIPGNEFLTGVGTIIELTPLDQNGNPIPDITVLESVTPSTTIQNPNFVTFPGGVVTDIVARGAHTTAPLTLQQAGDIIVPILSTPTTISQTHSVLMKSPTSSVWALAVHQRTLTNVDSQGNLRPFINAQTMRTVNNFTITVTKVDVVQIPMVRCLRVF